jgi:DNA-binding IclR family transcriptional regulator
VAAPVLGQQGAPVAALSVVTLSARVEPAALTPAVITVARAISRALSAAGADPRELIEPTGTPASGR